MKESLFDELKAHIIRKLESQIHELKLTVAFMVIRKHEMMIEYKCFRSYLDTRSRVSLILKILIH